MRVGLLGYGRMGAAMASRIQAEGHPLIVWNRSPGPAAAAAALGTRLAATPATLVKECDVALSSLFDEAAMRAVYLGPDGVCSADLGGHLILDTSTAPPGMGPELAAAVGAAGGRFVDAPVLGTVAPAREGKLIALVGGGKLEADEARAVLQPLCRAVHHLGPHGAGYAGKLAINLMKGTYWAALGDCLGLARRFGIEPGAILDVIESGPGAIVELPGKMPVLRGLPTEPAFDIAGGLKDLNDIIAAGGGEEAVPVAAGARAAVRRAIAAGWGNRDVASTALFMAAKIAAEDADAADAADAAEGGNR